jgi:hypothetical protein
VAWFHGEGRSQRESRIRCHDLKTKLRDTNEQASSWPPVSPAYQTRPWLRWRTASQVKLSHAHNPCYLKNLKCLNRHTLGISNSLLALVPRPKPFARPCFSSIPYLKRLAEHVPLHVLEGRLFGRSGSFWLYENLSNSTSTSHSFGAVAIGKVAGFRIYLQSFGSISTAFVPLLPATFRARGAFLLKHASHQIVHHSQLQERMACYRSILCAHIHGNLASCQNQFNHDPN